MLKGLKYRIFKTTLAVKIWITMVLTTLMVILFIQVSFNIFFQKFTLNNSISSAIYETSYTADTFSSSYIDLMNRFVIRTSSLEFKKNFRAMLNATPDNYTTINNSLQTVFREYTQMNTLNEAVVFARKETDKKSTLLFHSYNNRLKKEISSYELNFDLTQIDGITILPSSESPFLSQPEVLTIVIPLKYTGINETILIAESLEETDIILYYFLNTTKILNFLELYCNDESKGLLYLSNSQGQNMSLPSSHTEQILVSEETLSFEIKEAIASGVSYFNYEDNYVFLHPLSDTNLYLINILSNEKITSKSHNISMFLLGMALISLLMITLLSFMVSLFVTRPLKQLMTLVNEIKTNRYKGKLKSLSKDEIGQLGDEIDSMYNTIQQQILSIKREEEENYKSKLQLLTEQVNPHFLYNALEFINMEVYNNHTKEASGMITSLGNYLRISLAHGENELLVRQEVEQVRAYVNIMNYRFSNRIEVITEMSENLLNKKILKCIMQPIVENSLKHGFKIGSVTGFPVRPIIHISLTVKESYATLTITDNGAGIDTQKATKSMLTKQTPNSPDKHFGLNNIYQRLTTYYGDVDITFTSIPFYANKTIITFPVDW